MMTDYTGAPEQLLKIAEAMYKSGWIHDGKVYYHKNYPQYDNPEDEPRHQPEGNLLDPENNAEQLLDVALYTINAGYEFRKFSNHQYLAQNAYMRFKDYNFSTVALSAVWAIAEEGEDRECLKGPVQHFNEDIPI